MKILVINGPNINMLGMREPEIYGTQTYADLEKSIENYATSKKAEGLPQIEIRVVQSNCEGDIVHMIHHAYGNYDALILNPGAFTHYSYAIYDALLSVSLPAVEVHISNVYKREEFRHKSVVAAACIGQISGFGFNSYLMAIDYLLNEKV